MNAFLAKIFGNRPGVIFRLYMAAVLFQFSLLSFASVDLAATNDLCFGAFNMARDISFWLGVFSSLGACSLAFRSKYVNWPLGILLSESAAVLAFVTLSYDYLTRKPPIIAGSVLSITAAIFLIGGLIYERRNP